MPERGPYRVEAMPAARRDLQALTRVERDTRVRIDTAILALASDPRPHGSIKLQGSEFYRVVVGDYRIIYSVDDGERMVLLLRIRHRREVYRDY